MNHVSLKPSGRMVPCCAGTYTVRIAETGEIHHNVSADQAQTVAEMLAEVADAYGSITVTITPDA